MVIRVTAQGTTRVKRITAAGTTIVKSITVGTPRITGAASVGTVGGLDDVNTSARQQGYILRWDSDNSEFKFVDPRPDARNAVSAADLGGDGSFSYDSSSGIFSYTGPSATEVRAHFQGLNSIKYDNTTGIIDYSFDSDITNLQLDVTPKVSEAVNLGSPTKRFGELYLSGNSIHLGGIIAKNVNEEFAVVDSADAPIKFSFAGNTTNDLTEGDSNLYYTNARARSSLTVTTNGTGLISYSADSGNFTFRDSDFARTDIQDVFHEGLTIPDTKKIVFCDNVADIFENGGNFFIRRTNNDLPGESGGNIYLMTKDSGFFYIKSYDGDRDLAHFHDNGPVQLYYANTLKLATTDSGVNITGNMSVSEGMTVGNNMLVTGNLQVEGTTTTINSTTLTINDKNIVLADSAADSSAANGSGITVGGAGASITYTYLTDTWDLNRPLGTNINTLANYTTTNLSEGTNLYYETARADSDARHSISVRGDLSYEVSTGTILFSLDSHTTTDLAEGTNLYYLKSRFDSDLATKTTDNLAEGSNLYYTTDRADSDFDIRLATKTTTNLTEGTNLYYTRARFDSDLGDSTSTGTIRSYFQASGDLNYNSETGIFSFNLSNFTTDSVAEGSNLYYTTTRFDSDFNDNTTDQLTEGSSNLYYTATRVDSDFDARLATKSTTDLAEGTNLYYTTARADSDARYAISTSGDLSYNPATGVMSIDVEQVYSFANFDSDLRQRLVTTTTDSIGEGSINLYYTTARADSDARYALEITDAGGDGSLTYHKPTGVITYTGPSAAEVRAHFGASGDISYDSSTGVFSVDVSDIYSKAEFDSDLGDANTDLLPEGTTNLYYTTPRADSDFDVRLATKSTTDLSEGTNLYYLTSRADSDFDVRLATKTTTNLTEGTNLYYLTSRADSDFDVRLATKTTTNLTEGDNLYYLTSRSDSDFDVRLATKSTTDLSEGTNLYYTTARADSDAKHSLQAGTSIVYSSSTGTISTIQGIDSTDDVKFNTVTNKDGTTTNTPGEVVVTSASAQVLDQFAHNTSPTSFEYLIHLFDSTNSATQITKMIGTFDGTNIASNEFGTVFTGSGYMGELDFDLNGGNIRLLYTKEAGLGTVRTKAVKTVIS